MFQNAISDLARYLSGPLGPP